MIYDLGAIRNVTVTFNQRVQLEVENEDAEIEIKSDDRFGIFGSNNPSTIATIVSHDWFYPFDGQVIFKRKI